MELERLEASIVGLKNPYIKNEPARSMGGKLPLNT
jgi:hypothetical protein